MAGLRILTSLVFLLISMSGLSYSNLYYGLSLGTFPSESTEVKGEVFSVNEHTLFIKGFECGGICEGVVFWAGTSENPDDNGFIIPSDISHRSMSLPSYVKQDVMLLLPKDKNMKNLRWLAVKNKNSTKSLGTLMLSNTLQPPHPMFIGSLVNTKKGVSTGDILVVDTQTIVVPEFNFNGLEKETYWWLSKGTRPSDNGIRLLENESEENNTVIIMLPKGHNLHDYDTLSVWSKSEEENLGFVDIPKNLNIPPSPRNLGKEEMKMGEFNCEMLNDNLGLEVRWLIKGDDIIIHLVGNIGTSEYMAIGLSKDDAEIRFDTADAVVAGIDDDGKSFAVDYFFESNKYEKGRRMCSDTSYGKTNDVELLHGERRGSSAMVIFKRRLRAEDKIYDQNIYTDGPQSILWAVGQLLSDGCADTPTLQSRGSLLLDFGREPNWNCPPPITAGPPTYSEEKSHYIHCPSNQNFRAQLGSSSSNDKKIWFINGLPIPEITVQRGNTYTFIVEGGTNPPLHHPLYITDSKEGGLYRNIVEEIESQEVTYAGIDEDPVNGTIFPTAEGRLCDWSYADKSPEYLVETESKDIKPALVLRCEPGQPGRLIWIPSALTPDTVYYQSFMEKNLGGKIHVVDFCEESNPHRYLEFNSKEEKSNDNQYNLEDDGLEREIDADSFSHFTNTENEEKLKAEVFNESGGKEELYENIPAETIPEPFPPKIENHPLDNAINTLSVSANSFDEVANATDNHIRESTTSPSQISITSEEIFPHDESERSDIYLAQKSVSETVDVDETSSNSHRNKAEQFIKPSSYSDSDIVGSSASVKVPAQEFKPQFEGGFMPLVMNPMKDKEFEQKRSVYFTQYQNRPRKPFLYNESVPFHESFKPGVPDFSGFNISNYSQEDASVIIPNHQDNLQILSASKPQLMYKPFPRVNPLSAQLLQLHNEPLLESERPQNVGPRIRPQNPSMSGIHKNLFPPPSLNSRPGFPFLNMNDEDLSLVSSQRVYAILQAAGDKKPNSVPIQHLEIPTIRNRKPSNPQQNKMSYPSHTQRRPDFYEQKENNPNSNAPQRNFNIPRMPPNINKQIFQKSNIPGLQPNGKHRQVNSRSPVRNPNPPPGGILPGNIDQVMIPPGQNIHLRPGMQAPTNKRLPVPNQQKEIPLVPDSTKGERLLNDGVSNPSQIMGGRVPFPFHMINPNIKVSLESPKPVFSHDSDISSSKERTLLQSSINAEHDEMSNIKNMQQNFPAINPSVMIQNLHAPNVRNHQYQILPNMHSNVRNPQIIHSIPQQQPNHKNIAPEIASPPKSFNTSANLNTPSQEIKYNPTVSEIYETFIQNAGINPPIISDPSFEIDTSDRSDEIAETTEFKNLDVPFGARLKFPQNRSKIPMRPFNQHPRIPASVIRRPQGTLKNSHSSESKPTELQIAESFSRNPTTTTLIAQKNFTNIDNNEKHLNETPQFSSFNSSATFNKDNDVNLVPIIIETSKDKQHLGIKNSFLFNSNSSHPSILVPLRTLDNVNLPQISENPPIHDNRTDYSILNHVLTLIGGPSDV